jgi:hypothetical protein
VENGLEVVNERKLSHVPRLKFLKDKGRCEAAFKELEDIDWIKRREFGRRGRPALDWVVNPQVTAGISDAGVAA